MLFLGHEGRFAVVTTCYPAGFALEAEEAVYWATQPWKYRLCALSFAEFVWRWWMDNDIFYTLQLKRQEPTWQQREYLRGYARPADVGGI